MSEAIKKTELEERAEAVVRSPVLKMISVGADRTTRELSNQLDEETTRRAFLEAGAIPPPFNLRTLCEVFECSSALRPNVDAMAANVDGNGHHFVPVLDVDADDALDRVAESIYIERLAARERGQVVPEVVPTLEEAEKELDRIEDMMRLERFRLESFFERCVIDESFVSLRKKTRQDLEVTGCAFWEVLRDSRGEVAQFCHLQSHTMRLLPQGREFVSVVQPIRVAPLAMGTEHVSRRFRRFVQVVEPSAHATTRRIFFKEFGDPRVYSSVTGSRYATLDDLRSKEPTATQATEVLYMRIYSPTSPYGVPRWVGNMFNVLGATQAEEVNFLYFENKSVPPMALLVSGGRISEDSVSKLEDFINTEIKGRRNFHKILIIEAEPSGGDSPDGLATGKMKLELRPLTNAQNSDALFQKYDERVHDKVGMSFRLPRLLRGDVRDFNRSTAESAIEFAETQVFGPERTEFDFQMNRIVLGTLGTRYFKFQSNAVLLRDPKVLAGIIAQLTTSNVLVPADARALAADLVFNRPLSKIESDWVYQPVMLSQVGIPLDTKIDGSIPGLNANTVPNPPQEPSGPGGGNAQPAAPAQKAGPWGTYGGRRGRNAKAKAEAAAFAMVRDLLKARDELLKLEATAAEKQHAEAAKEDSSDDELEVCRITMPAEEIRKRFRIVPT